MAPPGRAPLRPPRPPYWICSPRTPTCRQYHPYIAYQANDRGSVIDYRGVSGWLLFTCGSCHTHSFGVQDAVNEMLHMYEISEAQLETLRKMPRQTKSWILLEFLGYMSNRDADVERAAAADPELEATLARS